MRNFHTTNRPIIKRRKSLYDVVACAENKISIESSASPQAQDHIISIIFEFNKYFNKPIKETGLKSSIFILIISYIIYLCFDLSTNQFQFVREYYNLGFFDICLGIDGCSIYFVVRPSEIRLRKSFRCKGKIIKFRGFLKIMVPSCN